MEMSPSPLGSTLTPGSYFQNCLLWKTHSSEVRNVVSVVVSSEGLNETVIFFLGWVFTYFFQFSSELNALGR